MATVREGNKSALLVVDIRVGVTVEVSDAPRIVENVACAVERARTQTIIAPLSLSTISNSEHIGELHARRTGQPNKVG